MLSGILCKERSNLSSVKFKRHGADRYSLCLKYGVFSPGFLVVFADMANNTPTRISTRLSNTDPPWSGLSMNR